MDRAKTLPLCDRETIGWLISRDDEVIRLAHTFDPPDGVSDVFVIPTGWVRRVERI
jgi:hypothetical protein